ncbi:fused isobutyryl-CoA mutase/GTPase IcmF [Thioalkalivibrio sp. HK1]|uniref:fused isobutyryl-CoA mutase/GTPase IcmF n=1 Tax=Thioalkalivibrio sp. HK1 TaxID=1469245 RepID=UPI0009DF6C2A|nr:fused isobutyryl-CoA mutase/GTPase IcmF [Thioalkalivibrio sp. HK1]
MAEPAPLAYPASPATPEAGDSSGVHPSCIEPEAQATKRIRFITAAGLFDGHDASINIMRRILQSAGAEVVHLGHNRSVEEVVVAAIDEDADAIAVSSYQGGHLEYFGYMAKILRERGGEDIRIFGGGGGVIIPEEIEELHARGITRIYSPEDGRTLGLRGMIDDMIARCDGGAKSLPLSALDDLTCKPGAPSRLALARVITAIEDGTLDPALKDAIVDRARSLPEPAPVIGITGTGGAGKSSLTDEILRRFRLDRKDALRIAVLAIDPSRRRSGGALLGDRIRMNAIHHPNIYMRSLATRDSSREIPDCLAETIAATRLAGFDLVLVETSGIGQGDASIVPFVDRSLYVMTPEFGAASQLEKIDMLDFADLVVINKFDRKGAEDALRDVRKQVQRNHERFDRPPESMPVYGVIASRFNDDGVTALYHGLIESLGAHSSIGKEIGTLPVPEAKCSSTAHPIVPASRSRYLAEIAQTLRDYRIRVEEQAGQARRCQRLREVMRLLNESGEEEAAIAPVIRLLRESEGALDERSRTLLGEWPAIRKGYEGDERSPEGSESEGSKGGEKGILLRRTTLSGTSIPRIALPRFSDEGDLLRFLMEEHLPGHFPFTAGVFPFKRAGEDPSRMFAGEGDAKRTNRRFRLLSEHSSAKRLSTAFDSVTLYGFDPSHRPDIYGKVGNSGVSIATIDDIKTLYDGFDLCDPKTSVSMTINGPAPTILAMFLNTAIDQRLDRFESDAGRPPDEAEAREIRARVLAGVRGTVQADILKEDQGQNTCIFSTEFSLKLMGDIQQWFVRHRVRYFYSVSISGYHIAEAGANPISQLAFTLANGFCYVEAWLARGMKIDDFAPNLSFFFSNGMDAEYSVLGRVARRIWAVAMRDRYGANERSQKLKYHIQTSGRSLHAQEIDFNDIRTTLQALIATYDHCNSLHTNAYDEAITTPTDDSVRRAVAIQMIINREWGLSRNENPNQGSFLIEELTDLVEEAVLAEFERISDRGGVLGAMETGYQRGRIQDESIAYEQKKHDGSLPIVGVNTFVNPNAASDRTTISLARSTSKEKEEQIERLRAFHERHAGQAPLALERLRKAALEGENLFEALMDAVRCCSLGQITDTLFEVGGQYRRSM